MSGGAPTHRESRSIFPPERWEAVPSAAMTPRKDHPGLDDASIIRRLAVEGPLGAPRFIWILLMITLGLGFVFVLDVALGRPSGSLGDVVDLDGEANLPTWFASIEWFAVAAVMALVADRRVDRADRRSWALWLLPLVFLVFSMDEVVMGHEYAGALTDVVLPGGSRADSILPVTGAFGLTIGIPFVVLFGILLGLTRPYLRPPDGAYTRMLIGASLFLLGAVGLDLLSNALVPGSSAAAVGVYIEESLELVGATMILWGAYLLAVLPGRR